MANTRTVIPAGNIASKLLAWSRLRDKLIEFRAGMDAEITRQPEQNPNAGSQDPSSSEEISNAIAKTLERVAYWKEQMKNRDANPDQNAGGAPGGKIPEEYLDHPDLGAKPDADAKPRIGTKPGSNAKPDYDDSGSVIADVGSSIVGGLLSVVGSIVDDD